MNYWSCLIRTNLKSLLGKNVRITCMFAIVFLHWDMVWNRFLLLKDILLLLKI